MQYNARCEFFNSSIFRPNPDCKDNKCRNKQAEILETGRSFIEERKKRINLQKLTKSGKHAYFSGDEVNPSEWGIELVAESNNERKEDFISKEDQGQFTLEELMGKIKNMSLAPKKDQNN